MIAILCLLPAVGFTMVAMLVVYAYDPQLLPWVAGGGFGIPLILALSMLALDNKLPRLAGNEGDDQAVKGRLFLVPEVGLLFVWLWLIFWIVVGLWLGLDVRGISLL